MADVRAIDANALKNAIRAESWKEDITVKMAVEYINILIDEQPTINPDDCRPRGRWIKLDASGSMANFKCSACDTPSYVPTRMGEPIDKYCPDCGAKMDGKENEDA